MSSLSLSTIKDLLEKDFNSFLKSNNSTREYNYHLINNNIVITKVTNGETEITILRTGKKEIELINHIDMIKHYTLAELRKFLEAINNNQF